MITTGWDGSDCTNKAQVVNIQSDSTCTGLADYPMDLWGATGGVIDGRPLICGGTSSGSNNEQSSCYIFNKELHQWQLHANLKTERYEAASAILDNGNLFITGGY